MSCKMIHFMIKQQLYVGVRKGEFNSLSSFSPQQEQFCDNRRKLGKVYSLAICSPKQEQFCDNIEGG